MGKLPDPPARFTLPPDVQSCPAKLRFWRIYFRSGSHATTWNEFRHYGPTGSRFDHHLPPARVQADRGVLYATVGENAGLTVLAEVFQQTRVIDRQRDEPWLAAFDLVAPISLLRTDRRWPVRAGGNMAINSGSRERARRWSVAVHASYTELHGIWYLSSLTNEPCVALYERALPSIPTSPVFNEASSSPKLFPTLTQLARELGFALR